MWQSSNAWSSERIEVWDGVEDLRPDFTNHAWVDYSGMEPTVTTMVQV